MTIKIAGNTYPVRDKLRQLGCRWDATAKAWIAENETMASQARLIVFQQGPLNSPPPADLTGDEKPVDLAAKYGRTAVEGARATEFSVYGLEKGVQPKPDGTIRVIRGKRYVQVAHTARIYLSRDYLEDMDLFDAEPGGSYQWTGVEVVATEAEVAESTAKAAAKESAERPVRRRREIVAIVHQVSHYRHEHDMTGARKVWGDTRMAGSEGMYVQGDALVYCTSSYDDSPKYWVLVDAALASEATALATTTAAEKGK